LENNSMDNNGTGKIIDIDIESEVKKSFISYAMAVNISRALPDVRDGLKPVHRRILYSMYENGYTYDKPTRKSARIVGDVMGKYHPHGDSSIYDALVRLAQPFSIRYTLAFGQGNFGTIDGDPAAASRYTEAKLSKIAGELLADIDKETVDFYPNFDETELQPRVLPSRFPNLMVNGSDGIAVGMATNIPPHNLREVIDGVVAMIENADITSEELMNYIKGPDFPTAAQIMGVSGIRETYLTGKGKIVTRAKHEIEEMSGGRQRIVITEIPYQVNKAKLIERIAELYKDKQFDGLSALRDESNKDGMRIVLELKKDVNPQVVLNFLYKHTQLQDSFGAIMLALVDGEPRILTLREMLYYYLEHQKEVITRRTQYDLDKALKRLSLVEGFLRALDNIDRVITIIRSSHTSEQARDGLMSEFGFDIEQTKAILDMRLQRLVGLEREKLEQEYAELQANIEHFRAILSNPQMVLDIIKEELLVIKDKYGDDRKTEITPVEDEIDAESLIQPEDMVVTMTHIGYIKRVPADTYRVQRRGGKGVVGLTTREEDYVERVIVANTHTDMLFFTTRGRVFKLRCYQIPVGGRTAKGSAIVNLLNLEPNEKVTTVITLPEGEEARENLNLVMATRLGVIKKTALNEYNIRKNGLNAINLREEDTLVNVALTRGESDIIVATAQGKAIRFEERLVRNMGRIATGVGAIKLAEGDYVVNMAPIDGDCDIFTITENGYGKRTNASEYRVTGRNCKGITTHGLNEKTGNIIDMAVVKGDEDILLITDDGTIIRTQISEIRTMGRTTQGVRVMRVGEARLVAIATTMHEDEEDTAEEQVADSATENTEANEIETL